MPTPPHTAISDFLRAHPLPAGALLLAAVSGGADSLTLLHTLADAREAFALTLQAAYLNHGMRPEAEEDGRRLAETCAAMGVPLTVGRADVPALAASHRVSLEVAGRSARYAFLYRLAHELGAAGICTGHTLDDLAETLLLRLAAGTGLLGLSGIAPARLVTPPESPSPVWLYRPLLTVTRAQTAAFCAERGLAVVHDPANQDPRYPRNRVRHTLLPLLEERFNPAIRSALGRLADVARAEDEYLTAQAESALPLDPAPGGASAPREALLALPLALRRRVARRLLAAAGARGKALGYANVEGVLEAAEARTRRSLDGGVYAAGLGGRVVVARTAEARGAEPFCTPLALPGEAAFPYGRIRAELVPGAVISTEPGMATMDAGALAGPLLVRNRRNGDRMRPLGAPGERKVADILTDRRVPRDRRDRIPVLLCGEQIAWLGGVCVADRFRVREETRTTAVFTLEMPPFASAQATEHTNEGAK